MFFVGIFVFFWGKNRGDFFLGDIFQDFVLSNKNIICQSFIKGYDVIFFRNFL